MFSDARRYSELRQSILTDGTCVSAAPASPVRVPALRVAAPWVGRRVAGARLHGRAQCRSARGTVPGAQHHGCARGGCARGVGAGVTRLCLAELASRLGGRLGAADFQGRPRLPGLPYVQRERKWNPAPSPIRVAGAWAWA